MKQELRDTINTRSQGRCEAQIFDGPSYERCRNPATDIHHALTAARGGHILDDSGETYHLWHLCRMCHMKADGDKAYEIGLLLRGYVLTVNGKPEYTGPDEHLTIRFGRK